MNELIAHGHPNPARYTPGQILVYLEAIARRERRQRRQRILDDRLARADVADLKRELRKLED